MAYRWRGSPGSRPRCWPRPETVLERLEKRQRGEYASKNVRQLDLFAEEADPIASELAKLDLKALSGEDALAKLAKLKTIYAKGA